MRIAFTEKRYDEAINLCQQILADNPELTSVCRSLGLIYVEDNQPLKAIDCYQKYIEKNPNDALINYHFALAYEAAGKKSKAKKTSGTFGNLKQDNRRSEQEKREESKRIL